MVSLESRHALQVNEHLLLTALTTRSIEIMGGERITTRLSPAAAAEARDSLAKNLYARLFDWIVAAVNRKISALGASKPISRPPSPLVSSTLHFPWALGWYPYAFSCSELHPKVAHAQQHTLRFCST